MKKYEKLLIIMKIYAIIVIVMYSIRSFYTQLDITQHSYTQLCLYNYEKV